MEPISVSEGWTASKVPVNSSVSLSTFVMESFTVPVPFTSTLIFSFASSSSSPPKATRPWAYSTPVFAALALGSKKSPVL